MGQKRLKMKKLPTDEMCICKHLRSEHNDLPYNIPEAIGKADCAESSCTCIRFTWDYFIYDTNPAKKIVYRKPEDGSDNS
jgi:hypothetical protein